MPIFALFLFMSSLTWAQIADPSFRVMNSLHEATFQKSLDIIITKKPDLALKIFRSTRNKNILTHRDVINQLSLAPLNEKEINLLIESLQAKHPEFYKDFKKRLQAFYLIFQKRMDYERRLKPVLEDIHNIIDHFKPYQILEAQDKELYYSLAKELIKNDKDLLSKHLDHIYKENDLEKSIDWALEMPFFKNIEGITEYEEGALVPKEIADLANLSSEDFDRYIQQNQITEMRSLLANHLQTMDLLQDAILTEALLFDYETKAIKLAPSALSSNFAIGFSLLNNNEYLAILGKRLTETIYGDLFYQVQLGVEEDIPNKIIAFLQSIIQPKEAYIFKKNLYHWNDPQKTRIADGLADFILSYELLKRNKVTIEATDKLLPHHTPHIVGKIGKYIHLQDYQTITDEEVNELARTRLVKCLQFWM